MRFLYLLPLLAILACGGDEPDASASPAPAAAPTYPTETARVETIDRPLRITGRVVPLQVATISSQVPGRVLPSEKLLQEGKYYHDGETLLTIDDEQLRYALQSERSQLVTSLVAILSDLSIDYPGQHKTWENFTNSIKADRPLPELPEIADEQLNYFISARGIPAQYYGIKSREATLDDYTVTAPFSGQLTSANIQPGSIVQPGQVLATITRTDIYELRASVPAAAIGQVSIGQKITLMARSLGKEYTGTVNRFGPSIDQGTQSVTAFVRVSGEELKEGLYLEAELPGAALKNVTALPKEALLRDNTVRVITPDSFVRAKPVEVVLLESDLVYLRGLDPGDRVITAAVSGTITGTKAR